MLCQTIDLVYVYIYMVQSMYRNESLLWMWTLILSLLKFFFMYYIDGLAQDY